MGKIDWVEILEPRSGEKMYVNLISGECGWDEPRGVSIKRLHEQDGHQWWELFDTKTSRFYYYNATTQQTCWQKPKSSSAIIIPLAKFQLLKQTNGVSSPSFSTQNGNHSSSRRRSVASSSRGREMKDVSCQTRTSCIVTVNNSTQTTPPPSLRRNMIHCNYYVSGATAAPGLNDTWSTKRSLRSYLINEARSAKGLSGVAGQEDASDFDDEVWESEDDCEDESTTSDQWDADDEHDREDVDDEEDFEEEDEKEVESASKSKPVVTRSESEFDEYGTEDDERRTDSRARDSADNQSSIGETYVDTSFVFVPTESSTWNRNEQQKKERLKHSQTLQEELQRRKPEEGRNGSFSGSDHGIEVNRRGSTGKTGPPSYIPSPPSSSWAATDRKPHPPPHQHPLGPPPPPPPARGHSLNNSDSFSRSREVPTNTSSPSSSLVSSSSRPSPHSHLQAQEQRQQHSLGRPRDHLHSFTPPAPPQGFSSPVDKASSSTNRQCKTPEEVEERTSKPSKDSKKGSSRKENKAKSSAQETGIMEKFARENVVRHIKRGVGNQLLKRKTSLKAMLTWSKNSIRQPMIATLTTMSSSSKNEIKAEAIQCFKLIQQFMGDRSISSSKDSSVAQGSSIGSAKETIAFELVTMACLRHELRDEIYVQLCRQTTNNPRKSSLTAGFELMACCLCYFPPSVKFSPYLASFLANSPAKEVEITCKDDEETISLIEHCYRLLVKVRGIHLTEGALNSLSSSGVIYCRKPVTPKELEMVMEAIERRFVGIFGESIDSLLKLQGRRWPNRRLPWILTTLCEAILKMGGTSIEGIFRIAADTDESSFIKLVIDCINFDLLDDDGDILELLNHNTDEPVDVHVFACLLKQWFRSLKDPIIPYDLYEECLESSSSRREVASIVLEKLPKDNKLVLGYLIRFLQVFAAPEIVNLTKMDDSNLAVIWSPNILRSSQPLMNPFGMHPSTVYENTRKEMTFIRTLIQTLDTSFIQGVY